MRFILQALLWRRSRTRVASEADRLLAVHGEVAVMKAHELAWAARDEGARAKERFYAAVARALVHRARRQALIAAIMAASPDPVPPPISEPRPAAPARPAFGRRTKKLRPVLPEIRPELTL